ncbi:MAG: formate dehydrogenase [Acidobacteria bacterium]|nr:MAG: formate dehydrogenase [Acidobacteriota bacterium]
MSALSRRAGWAPFGLGERKPRHFRGMLRVLWENRGRWRYAWRILDRGVCDGCALGTTGMRDWTLDSVHLCMVRLDLLRLNTMRQLDVEALPPVDRLERMDGAELRALGRIPSPLLREHGEARFREVSWDEAMRRCAASVAAADPRRLAFYLTSRGIPNETYYVAQKVARFLGTPHIDNSARLCHAASTVAMKRALGHGASTGSYRDWLEADLIVFFGSNTPNNQPVTTKYLVEGKQRGLRIAAVNPYREPGLERYWVPSNVGSALFGTRLVDDWFEVDTGGDLAFLNGVLKALLALPDGVDEAFVRERCAGWPQVREHVEALGWEAIEQGSGASRQRIEEFARLLVRHPNTIFVWSMGLTQHEHGVDTVQALCNVGLARALPGHPLRGLTPIRGHSGVQGGAEVGCVPTLDEETRELWGRVWGFAPPAGPGHAAVAQIEAAARGEIDVFWIVGGSFLDTVPDEARNRQALARPRLRVHQDLVFNRSMLVDPQPGCATLLLPAATRYEMPGGVTETTTERRIVFSPEVPGPRVRGARPEWEVLCELAALVHPDRADLVTFGDTAAIRREIAAAIPLYQGIERLAEQGDQVQWGGPTLFADGVFATPDGRARFVPVSAPERRRQPGELWLSTRRGHQFNSIVHSPTDPLNGAGRRDVLISHRDAVRLGLEHGQEVRLRSAHGEMRARVHRCRMRPGNVEVHWPEGMALLGQAIDHQSGEPDYGAAVRIEPLTDTDAPRAAR